MRNLLKLMIVMILFTVMSCDKDKDKSEITGPKCLLTKRTFITATSTDVITFQYDSKRRLIGSVEGNLTYKIEYNSDGKLSKIFGYENGENDKLDEDCAQYTWTATTLTESYMYKDTVGNWVEDDNKKVFNIDADGNVIKSIFYYKVDGEWIEGKNYLVSIWFDGNLIKNEGWRSEDNPQIGKTLISDMFFNSTYPGSLKSMSDVFSFSNTFSYDEKNNAYTSVEALFGIGYVSKNNVVKRVFAWGDSVNGGSEVRNYTYEYNSDGFPTKIFEEFVIGENTIKNEIMLEYSCN